MLNNNNLILELKYYQMYLGKIVAFYNINEKICDFFTKDKKHYTLYQSCLGEISSSLRMSQRIIADTLLSDKDSFSIPKLINKLSSNKVFLNETDEIIKNKIICEMNDIISNNSDIICKLHKYRNNVYAHMHPGIYNDFWQEKFIHENNFNFNLILSAIVDLFDCLYRLIILLKGDPLEKSFMVPLDTNYLILSLQK